MIPVMRLRSNQTPSELSPGPKESTFSADPKTFRSRLLIVERAMADFLGPLSPTFSAETEHADIEVNAKV
jgi:hypothetical protein